MFRNILASIGASPAEKDLRRYSEIADQIVARGPAYEALTDAELRARTDAFRGQIRAAAAGLRDDAARREAENRALDEILIDAFAAVRAAAVRTIGLRHYPVQLISGLALHAGRAVEMRTGEGKTLVATLPLYLNALAGRGAHLVTVNDYLARRDARWMGPVYRCLGLEVGVLQDAARTDHAREAFLYDAEIESETEDIHQLRRAPRREAYAADITYGANHEFGFDYLRDNRAVRLADRRQRELNYALVDEVDSVLIDSARTPLIISGPAHFDSRLYGELAPVARQLRPAHYEIDERERTVALTEAGFERVEALLGRPLRDPLRPEAITPEQAQLLQHLEQALRAEFLYRRDKEYLVQDGRVYIIDEFTGRAMPSRRWSDGLHQAVEAKEGVEIRPENVPHATITLQNFFRMYAKLSGMSGTVVAAADEFEEIYDLPVIPIPTNLDDHARRDPDLIEVEFSEDGYKFSYIAHVDAPDTPVLHRRKDYADRVYRTREAKLRAITREIVARHARGQPLLVGTNSVAASEHLALRLRAGALCKLALVWLLRARWFEVNNRSEDGRPVPELAHLNKPLQKLDQVALHPLARELGLAPHPTDPENLSRLRKVLGLTENAIPRLQEILADGIPHQVLNARKHAEEAHIIAHAGQFGAVTIATNMAGRGVDIKLGGELPEETLRQVNRALKEAGVRDPYSLNNAARLAALEKLDPAAYDSYSEAFAAFRAHAVNERRVRELGGLYVIGSERHEARRIDNQLRGRAARQGDPGASRFYLSLEDDLLRRFGGMDVSKYVARLDDLDEALPLEPGRANKVVAQTQARVEETHLDMRKRLLDYDDVLNEQRNKFYAQRQRILMKPDLHADVEEMLAAEVEARVGRAETEVDGCWELLSWLDAIQPVLARPNGRLLFPFGVTVLLDELGRQVPALANFREAEAQTGQPAQAAAETLPAVRAALLEIIRYSMAAAGSALLADAERQLEASHARADAQARYGRDLAETAYEGALLHARESGLPLQAHAVAQEMIAAAKAPLHLAEAEVQSLYAGDVRDRIAARIEAAIIAGAQRATLQRVETRAGLRLELDLLAWSELDWNDLIDLALDALEEAHNAQSEKHCAEIEAVLAARLQAPEHLTQNALGTLLLDLAYRPAGETSEVLKTSEVWSLQGTRLQPRFPYLYYIAELLEDMEPSELTGRVLTHLHTALRIRAQIWAAVGSDGLPMETCRQLILSTGDQLWVDYLTKIQGLRTSIGLEGYARRDPLAAYKSRSFDQFAQLLADIRASVVARIFTLQPEG